MMKKSAFTMMELIFVIVIMGIIAGGTFIQISTIYEDMIQKQNSSELESEAKVIAEQVTARLSSSIKESLVALDDLGGADCKGVSTLVSGDNNGILAWVGRSDEANTGLWDDTIGDYLGWSGFVDVGIPPVSHASISTKGSKLDFAETVIDDLTGLTGSLSQPVNSSPVAIYFKEDMTTQQLESVCGDFGLDTAASPAKMHKVIKSSNTQLDFDSTATPPVISEQYAMSHSAYAIERNSSGGLLLYSFRPWNGEHANSPGVKKYILGQNVSSFAFKWDSGLFRINICVEKNSAGYPIRVCKEKAVF